MAILSHSGPYFSSHIFTALLDSSNRLIFAYLKGTSNSISLNWMFNPFPASKKTLTSDLRLMFLVSQKGTIYPVMQGRKLWVISDTFHIHYVTQILVLLLPNLSQISLVFLIQATITSHLDDCSGLTLVFPTSALTTLNPFSILQSPELFQINLILSCPHLKPCRCFLLFSPWSNLCITALAIQLLHGVFAWLPLLSRMLSQGSLHPLLLA